MKLKQIILENTIANLLKQIQIKVKIDKTKHANDRQSRHDDFYINDKDIIEIVNSSLEKIAESLLFNKIDMGDYVLLKRNYDNLNIVTNIQRAGDKIDVIVITVMKKQNFIPKTGTKTINI